MKLSKIIRPYNVCVIDIGSPKLGNIGWCTIDIDNHMMRNGDHLDDLVPIIASMLRDRGLILGLEAPLFIPLRDDLMLATKGRKGEGKRPWSAGAGAQVLSMNLPIMTYLFRRIKSLCPRIDVFVNEEKFSAQPYEMLVFEALVSGKDKGQSHIDDAQIMAEYCEKFSQQSELPPSILEIEDNTEYFNLTAASLMRCGIIKDDDCLHEASPIYKPSTECL